MRHYVDLNMLLYKALFILRPFLIKNVALGHIAVAMMSCLDTCVLLQPLLPQGPAEKDCPRAGAVFYCLAGLPCKEKTS